MLAIAPVSITHLHNIAIACGINNASRMHFLPASVCFRLVGTETKRRKVLQAEIWAGGALLF